MNRDELIEELKKCEENVEIYISTDLAKVNFDENGGDSILSEISWTDGDAQLSTCTIFTGEGFRLS